MVQSGWDIVCDYYQNIDTKSWVPWSKSVVTPLVASGTQVLALACSCLVLDDWAMAGGLCLPGSPRTFRHGVRSVLHARAPTHTHTSYFHAVLPHPNSLSTANFLLTLSRRWARTGRTTLSCCSRPAASSRAPGTTSPSFTPTRECPTSSTPERMRTHRLAPGKHALGFDACLHAASVPHHRGWTRDPNSPSSFPPYWSCSPVCVLGTAQTCCTPSWWRSQCSRRPRWR